MDLKELLTITGWFVSCALSVLAGGWLVPRITKKKSILAWGVISESELIPKRVLESVGPKISIKIGDHSPKSLALITVRMANVGSEVLTELRPLLEVPSGATVLHIRPTEDLGEFRKHVKAKIDQGSVRFAFDFLNLDACYEFELLVANYELGTIDLDAAASGLQVVRQRTGRWDVGKLGFLTKLSLSIFGIRYDPSTVALATIAEEIKVLRKSMQRQDG